MGQTWNAYKIGGIEMKPTVFYDIGIVKEIHKAQLTDSYGGQIYSPKADKLYSFGGQYLPNTKVDDKIKVFISFGHINGRIEED